jgi:3-hydroxyacyl-CoA dehydrogenase
MTQSVIVKQVGRIALLALNAPPVNALSARLRSALYDALAEAGRNDGVAAVVLTGEGRCFCAGADLAEFQSAAGSISNGRDPVELSMLIDAFRKPVIAALHGDVLGGGLELALGCHYRVAASTSKLGLPEIDLGLLPGAGGTQRLPRLVGVAQALDMILAGELVDVTNALDMGLVDDAAGGDLIEHAVRFAEGVLERGALMPRVRERAIQADSVPADFFDTMRAAVQKHRTSKDAAGRIIDCVEAAVRLPFDEGMKFERAQFEACNASVQAVALRHGFFARRGAAKIPGLPASTSVRQVECMAVVGGGTMGRGIAIACALAGYPVTLVETSAERAASAVDAIRGECERMGKSGRLSVDRAQSLPNLIKPSHKLADLASVDMVIEAIFEDLSLKMSMAADLGVVCKPGAIIASNTSTLDLNVLAQASGRAADFVGMHFFSPAHVMRLLEVVRGDCTAPDVLATVMAVARKLDKDPVVSGVCYGFIGNRMLEPYLRETEVLLLEGATPTQIDRALEQFGMAMGPCRMMDLAGVDVVAKVVIERDKQGTLPADPHYRIVCRELHAAGYHGQKTSLGFYRYDSRKLVDDAQAQTLIEALASRTGIERRANIDDNEIVERCLLPLINEGFLILEEGIAYREADVDVVWLSGYGFPASRGGPMFHARTMGITNLRERLAYYGSTLGNSYGYWTPASSLEEVDSRVLSNLTEVI